MSEFDELNKLGESKEMLQSKTNVTFLVLLVVGLIAIVVLGFIFWAFEKGFSLI